MRTASFALLAGFTLGVVTPAAAADLDYGVLRGPDYEPAIPVIDWSGVYVGGHGGYTSAALGFRNVFQPLVAKALIGTTAESEFNASSLLIPHSQRVEGGSFGAYAGFNYQFDDAVIGIEADYTRFEKIGATADSVTRFKTTADNFLETVSLSGLSSTKIEEYGTIRARGGYAFGNFLPYITGGVAIGRAQVTDQVTVNNYGYNQATYKANVATANSAITTTTDPAGNVVTTVKPAIPTYVDNYGYSTFNQTNPEKSTVAPGKVVTQSTNKTVAGIALGAGLEYALTQNIVLRGEYQYVLFNDFDGHKVNLNTVRGGAAVKF